MVGGGARCVLRMRRIWWETRARAADRWQPRWRSNARIVKCAVCRELPTCEDGFLRALYPDNRTTTWCSHISLAFHRRCRTYILLHDRVTRLEIGSCVSFRFLAIQIVDCRRYEPPVLRFSAASRRHRSVKNSKLIARYPWVYKIYLWVFIKFSVSLRGPAVTRGWLRKRVCITILFKFFFLFY